MTSPAAAPGPRAPSARPSATPVGPARSGPGEPPLRLTRRGLVRCVQLAATTGVLGSAAVSCTLLDGSRSRSVGAASADPAQGSGGAPVRGAGGAPTVAERSPSPGPTATAPMSPTRTSAVVAGRRGTAPETAATTATTTATETGGGAVPGGLPGVGATWTARLTGHGQVVLVSAAAMSATRNVVRWFDRTSSGWVQRGQTQGWNGSGGWVVRHTVGDLRSPTGMYSLTDAGGYAPNPGTSLPYQFAPSLYSTVINGVRTFEHVLAIDYNRVVGRPPSDNTRPAGWSAGGSIWFHVAHDSPTQACVGIADGALVALLRWLRPAAKPVVLMGPSSVLAT